MSTSDAVGREAAWLAQVDTLPTLIAPTGPFSIIQAYWPRTPQTRLPGLYLTRTGMTERRFANQRKIWSYQFRASLVWPIGATTTSVNIWELEQAAFDTAIDTLLARLRGTLGDHTHGGRFLSVAEAPEPGPISVRYADPEKTAAASPALLSADVTYTADDFDFTA